MDIRDKVRSMAENIMAANIPMKNRIYVKNWQIDKIKKLGIKIYTGPRGGQFIDNRELKAKGINLDEISNGKNSGAKISQNDNKVLERIENLLESGDIDKVKNELLELVNDKIDSKEYIEIISKLASNNDKFAEAFTSRDISSALKKEFNNNPEKFKEFLDVYNNVIESTRNYMHKTVFDKYSLSENSINLGKFDRAIYNMIGAAIAMSKLKRAKDEEFGEWINKLKEFGIDVNSSGLFSIVADVEGTKKLMELKDKDKIPNVLIENSCFYATDPWSNDSAWFKPKNYESTYKDEDVKNEVAKYIIYNSLIGNEDVEKDLIDIFNVDISDDIEFFKGLLELDIDEIDIDLFKADEKIINSVTYEYGGLDTLFRSIKEYLPDSNNDIASYLVGAYEYFYDIGYDEKMSMALAKSVEILRFWTMSDFKYYTRHMEDYIHELSGNHRPLRKKYEIEAKDLNSLLKKHLLEDCKNEFALAKKLSQEIFRKVHGDELKVYRGVSTYEGLQIIDKLLSGESDLKIDMTLASTSYSHDIALGFRNVDFVIETTAKADNVIGGWWNASPEYVDEDEIILEFERGGQPVKITSSMDLKKVCEDEFWDITIDNFEDLKVIKLHIQNFVQELNYCLTDTLLFIDDKDKPVKIFNNIMKNLNEKTKLLNIDKDILDYSDYDSFKKYIFKPLENIKRKVSGVDKDLIDEFIDEMTNKVKIE